MNRSRLTRPGRFFSGKLLRWREEAAPDEPDPAGSDFEETRRAYLDRIRVLAASGGADGIVYQSVVVAALRVLERTLTHERQAADAAISLGQRHKLRQMAATVESTIIGLRESLTPQGIRMLHLGTPAPRPSIERERYWWFALTEAIESLEEGTDWMAAMVAGQPRGSAARILSSVIVRLLHRHYCELLAEAEQWIGNE